MSAQRRVLFSLLLLPVIGCANGGGVDPRTRDGAARDSGPSLDAGRPDTGLDAPPIVMIDAGTRCGDGVIDGTEECEGTDLDGETCVSQGYVGGTLRCTPDCNFDKSMCVEAACGNGRRDAGETCDGIDLGSATCASSGFVSGSVTCAGDCTLDTSGCSACGDRNIDLGEECDGTDLAGATCATSGFTGGMLACDATCGLDTSGCFDANCGNGSLEMSEDCDGMDVGGRTCATYGFVAGALSCNADCTVRITACHNCGNGTIDGIEQCDGTALSGQTCATRGFTMGTLACTAMCAFDTSGCSTAACGNGRIEAGETCDDGNSAAGDGCTACAVNTGYSCTGAPSACTTICGDGMIVGGEQCDGSNLASQTCVTRGFTAGTLRCGATCSFDTALCTSTTCGNGAITSGEECDDGNTVGFDGCDSSCQVDPTFELPVRLRNGEGSNHGMLEVYYSGTWRDVCDDTYTASAQQAMADVVCRQLGFTGTGHTFLNAFGGGSGTPVMDDVNCTGPEANLSQCVFAGWGVENCGTTEAVGIRCMPGEGDVRLVGGPSGLEGRLQIFHAGAWGEVCDDYFDGVYSGYFGYSTTTVCQQLGYRGGTFVSTYDAPGDVFVLDDVNCTGTERRIESCPHLAYGTENCSATEGAGFRCELYAEGDVRLVGGANRASGRIEVLHQGVWGTVCDDFLESAGTRQTSFITVGCRQLGFTPRTGSALTSIAVPDGVDPTWVDDLNCAGTEARLASCPFSAWGVENCSHFEDIGLSCTP